MSKTTVKKQFADALYWMMGKRIESLRKSIRNEDETVKEVIEGTSIAELKLLRELIKKMKV